MTIDYESGCAKLPVTRVAETGPNVAGREGVGLIGESLIDGGHMNIDIRVLRMQRGHPFRCCDQPHKLDA